MTRRLRLRGFGDQLAGELVWRCEEEEVDVAVGEELPGEGVNWLACAGGSGELRVEIADVVFGGAFAGEEEGRRFEARMMEEKAGEFGSGVAADSHDGDVRQGRLRSSHGEMWLVGHRDR